MHVALSLSVAMFANMLSNPARNKSQVHTGLDLGEYFLYGLLYGLVRFAILWWH